MPETEEKKLLEEHIDQVIGQVLQVEGKRLDRILDPITMNPGRAAVSLNETIRVATMNDFQNLTPKRAKNLERQIKSAMNVYHTLAENDPENADDKKQRLHAMLLSLQGQLVAKSIEYIDETTPEHITKLEAVVSGALDDLKD